MDWQQGGVGWGGVEWSGVEWSGVEWSGALPYGFLCRLPHVTW